MTSSSLSKKEKLNLDSVSVWLTSAQDSSSYLGEVMSKKVIISTNISTYSTHARNNGCQGAFVLVLTKERCCTQALLKEGQSSFLGVALLIIAIQVRLSGSSLTYREDLYLLKVNLRGITKICTENTYSRGVIKRFLCP